MPRKTKAQKTARKVALRDLEPKKGADIVGGEDRQTQTSGGRQTQTSGN